MMIGIGLSLSRVPRVYSPAALFQGGEAGVWLDPSDLRTLFQDSAGTTPVTGTGQPVGRMLDKSGRANHVVQVTAGLRPTYQIDSAGRPYLAFDGVDDFLISAGTVDLSTATTATLFLGAYKNSDASFASLSAFGPSPATSPGWEFQVPNSGANIGFAHRGATATWSVTGVSAAAPRALVLTGISDLAGGMATLRLNGQPLGTASASTGGGTFGSSSLYIGRRGGSTFPFNGRVYSFIVRAVPSTASQIAETEAWVNGRTGAY